MQFIVVDQLLAFRVDQPITKDFSPLIIDAWVTFWVNQNYLIRVKQLLIALKQDLEIEFIVVRQPSTTVSHGVALHLIRHVQGRAHSLTHRAIAAKVWLDFGLLPNPFFFFVCAHIE